MLPWMLTRSSKSRKDTMARRGSNGAGPRRRLTLAPTAFSPASEGSPFSALGEEEEEDLVAEELAVSVAEDVLSEDRLVSRGDILCPSIPDDELAQEFWTYVGYPTRASRVWEHGSVEDGGGSNGKVSSVVCRTPGESMEGSRARSWSPPVGRSQSPAAGRPRSVDGGIGRALRRPAVRLGWRGPLPRPRITPPPCLGEFFPERMVAAMAEADDRRLAAATGARSLDRGLIHVIQNLHGGGPCGDPFDLARPGPWAHLARRFKGIWLNLDSPNASSSRSTTTCAARLLSPASVTLPPPSSSPIGGHRRSFAKVLAAPSVATSGQPSPLAGGRQTPATAASAVSGAGGSSSSTPGVNNAGGWLAANRRDSSGRPPSNLASRLERLLLPSRFPSSGRGRTRRALKGRPISPWRRQLLERVRGRKGRSMGTRAVVQGRWGMACNRLLLRCSSTACLSRCNLLLWLPLWQWRRRNNLLWLWRRLWRVPLRLRCLRRSRFIVGSASQRPMRLRIVWFSPTAMCVTIQSILHLNAPL